MPKNMSRLESSLGAAILVVLVLAIVYVSVAKKAPAPSAARDQAGLPSANSLAARAGNSSSRASPDVRDRAPEKGHDISPSAGEWQPVALPVSPSSSTGAVAPGESAGERMKRCCARFHDEANRGGSTRSSYEKMGSACEDARARFFSGGSASEELTSVVLSAFDDAAREAKLRPCDAHSDSSEARPEKPPAREMRSLRHAR